MTLLVLLPGTARLKAEWGSRLLWPRPGLPSKGLKGNRTLLEGGRKSPQTTKNVTCQNQTFFRVKNYFVSVTQFINNSFKSNKFPSTYTSHLSKANKHTKWKFTVPALLTESTSQWLVSSSSYIPLRRPEIWRARKPQICHPCLPQPHLPIMTLVPLLDSLLLRVASLLVLKQILLIFIASMGSQGTLSPLSYPFPSF